MYSFLNASVLILTEYFHDSITRYDWIMSRPHLLVPPLPSGNKNSSALCYSQRWHIMTYCSHQDKVLRPGAIFCNVKLLSRRHKYFAIYGTPHPPSLNSNFLASRIKYSIGLFVAAPNNVSHFFRPWSITPCRKLFTSCRVSFTSTLAYMHSRPGRGKIWTKRPEYNYTRSQNVPIKTWTRKAGLILGKTKVGSSPGILGRSLHLKPLWTLHHHSNTFSVSEFSWASSNIACVVLKLLFAT